MRNKYFILFTLTIMGCNVNCPCNNEQLNYFMNELEGYHLRAIKTSEINCEECGSLWLVKWNSEKNINKETRWDLVIEKDVMLPAKSIGLIGQADTSTCNSIHQFVKYARNKGYDISTSGLKDHHKIYVTIESKDGILIADQDYVKLNDQWVLDTTYNYYSGFKDFDINGNN